MGIITRDCPHCSTKKVAFYAFGEKKKRHSNNYTVAFYCNMCKDGIFIEFLDTSGGNARETPYNTIGNVEDLPFTIVKEYPLPQGPNIPKFLPQEIERCFLEAYTCLSNGEFTASRIMSRKVLEASAKIKDPDFNGNLYRRIENLNILPDELKEWAHIIREEGNEAAHEIESSSRQEATELMSFTDIFIRYVFTMPEMLKEKREQSQKHGHRPNEDEPSVDANKRFFIK